MLAMLAGSQSLSMQSMAPNWVFEVCAELSRSLVSLQLAHTELVPAEKVSGFG